MGAIERKGGTRSEKKGIKVARETGGGGGVRRAQRGSLEPERGDHGSQREGVMGARGGSWEPDRGGHGSQRQGVMGGRERGSWEA